MRLNYREVNFHASHTFYSVSRFGNKRNTRNKPYSLITGSIVIYPWAEREQNVIVLPLKVEFTNVVYLCFSSLSGFKIQRIFLLFSYE